MQKGGIMSNISNNDDKVKLSVYLRPETNEKLQSYYKPLGFRSKSDLIDDAINFYCGYLTADDCKDYYPAVITSAVKANLESLENRMARILFKYTVELTMLMNIIAATYNVDQGTLDKLRAKCVNEVKRLNGRINFEDVVRYQRYED